MEFGLYTLSDMTADPFTGIHPSAEQRIRDTIVTAEIADQAELDVFGVGEHHRLDFAVSAPAVVLSAIAGRTRTLRLSSAVTVLSAADPVRVFEDFSTLDLLSQGRAELIVGRGAFVEPFPLFGFDLGDYDALFDEKLRLLRLLGESEHVTWSGRYRAPLVRAEIAPRPLQRHIPTWIAVGGSPQSAHRAGTLGFPMALAALGGPIPALRPIAQLYREAGSQAGHDASALKLALTCHVHVGETSQGARETFYPYYAQYRSMGLPRRNLPRITRSEFDRATAARSALMVGSAAEIVDRILLANEVVAPDRFLAQIDLGALPFKEVTRVIERLAGDVIPQIRASLAKGNDAPRLEPRSIE